MAHKMNDARRSLIRAKEAAEARLKEIEHERREIKTSLKALDAALKALRGPQQRASSRKTVGTEATERSEEQV